MTQLIVRERVPDEVEALPEGLSEPGLILGRPVEDRAFEAVEAGVGLAAGIAIGSAFGGPIGAAVGGLVGVAGGIAAGEALERAEGRAATTTDAAESDLPEPG
ncbi:MAG: hypothetical protein AB1736_05175 [Chloroflexota bacterium]